jgi:hypothetical protein
MTTADLLQRLRALLDESQTGYYQDSELYNFLDDSQNYIVTFLLSKMFEKQKINPYFVFNCLTPLITGANLDYTDGGISLVSITDMLDSIYAKVQYDDMDDKLFSTKIDEQKANEITENTFLNPTVLNPKYYIRGTTMYLLPEPEEAQTRGVDLFYIKKPQAITSELTTPDLTDDVHEILIQLAFSYALAKDGRSQDSDAWHNKALIKLNIYDI